MSTLVTTDALGNGNGNKIFGFKVQDLLIGGIILAVVLYLVSESCGKNMLTENFWGYGWRRWHPYRYSRSYGLWPYYSGYPYYGSSWGTPWWWY